MTHGVEARPGEAFVVVVLAVVGVLLDVAEAQQQAVDAVDIDRVGIDVDRVPSRLRRIDGAFSDVGIDVSAHEGSEEDGGLGVEVLGEGYTELLDLGAVEHLEVVSREELIHVDGGGAGDIVWQAVGGVVPGHVEILVGAVAAHVDVNQRAACVIHEADGDRRAVADDLVAGLLGDLAEDGLLLDVEDMDLQAGLPCGILADDGHPLGLDVSLVGLVDDALGRIAAGVERHAVAEGAGLPSAVGLAAEVLIHADGGLLARRVLHVEGHDHLALLVDLGDHDGRAVGNDISLLVDEFEGVVHLFIRHNLCLSAQGAQHQQ